MQVGSQSMMGLSFSRENSHDTSTFRARVSHSGWAYRMRLPAFIEVTEQRCDIQRVLMAAYRVALRRVHFVMACSHHHNVEQQLIRWLLSCVHQIQQDTIEVTHAELSETLGFSREVITVTLGKLVHKGFISLSRGEVHVLNQPELERHACECFWLAQGRHRPIFSSLIAHA